MTIDLTESEYRTILDALVELADAVSVGQTQKRVLRLIDNLRVRWERAADEEQKEAGK